MIGTVPLLTLNPATNHGFVVGTLSMEDRRQIDPQGQLEPDLTAPWSEPNPTTYVYHLRQV
jgi:hypothetical protein